LKKDRILSLKVDCDTFEGTQKGIPRLLSIFHEFNVCATFFFTLGPDNSGRAIRRIFTQKGFLKKMLRSKAVSMYGPKTMLYGTLLPAPRIGEKLAEVIRSVEKAGHEVGVHGWDHVRWHDQLDKLTEEQIRRDYGLAHQTFENIFGHRAQSSAAPGWHITPLALKIQEEYGLLYTSNTRNGAPFYPKAGGIKFKTLEIPSTLPTWDEMLGSPDFKSPEDFLNFYGDLPEGVSVHSIHTEVEGMAWADLFRKQMTLWKNSGVKFAALEDIAKELLRNPAEIPGRQIVRIVIPNRGGLITSGTPA